MGLLPALNQPPPPTPADYVPEFVVAGLLGLMGLRSLRKWMRVSFDAGSLGEQILFALNVTARVGTWFVLAGFFVGYAVVDDPQRLGWFFFVLIAVAGVQLLTSFYLGRWSASLRRESNPGPEGNGRTMSAAEGRPGPLEPEKHGQTSDPGHPQPEAAEVESARVLANQAREALHGAGLDDREIRRLADEYIALDRGEGLPEFIEWARAQAGRANR